MQSLATPAHSYLPSMRVSIHPVILEEAYLDVELFGHASAPDRRLDDAVRHPGARGIARRAAAECGAAAAEGVECKEKRYPPRAGKCVTPCAIETWGFADAARIA